MPLNVSGSFGSIGPYLIVAPMLATILGFYGAMFALSKVLGTITGALAGVLWAVLVGAIANRMLQRLKQNVWLVNAPVFLAVIATGLMAGASLMYAWMMVAALNEPSTTYAVLSALMWPAVPFYITLNSAMELVLLALLVFWNWDSDGRRRAFVLVGVALYFAMRVWTYLVFAETRLDIARHALSPADVEWFKQTLATDFRVALTVITYVCLVTAALIPPWPRDWRAASPTGERDETL